MSTCPVTFALDMFGDKWSLLIVRDIMLHGLHTYGELLNSGDGIATNILADRLKILGVCGIIYRSNNPKDRRKYFYQLTDKGMTLAPLILELYRWGGRSDPNTGASKEFLSRLEKDPHSVLVDIQSGLLKF